MRFPPHVTQTYSTEKMVLQSSEGVCIVSGWFKINNKFHFLEISFQGFILRKVVIVPKST